MWQEGEDRGIGARTGQGARTGALARGRGKPRPYYTRPIARDTEMLRYAQHDTVTCISLAQLLLQPPQATQKRCAEEEQHQRENVSKGKHLLPPLFSYAFPASLFGVISLPCPSDTSTAGVTGRPIIASRGLSALNISARRLMPSRHLRIINGSP